MLLTNTPQILVVTISKTFILIIGIFFALLVLIFLHIDVLADFNSEPLHPALFTDNSITSGVEEEVKKVPVTDQMSSMWNYLYACDVLVPVELEGYILDCFVLDLRKLGKVKPKTIERKLNHNVHMAVI